MLDRNWLEKNTGELDKVENNNDKAYTLFVEVCDTLMEEHADWGKTKE
jgi:hypothetical protein